MYRPSLIVYILFYLLRCQAGSTNSEGKLIRALLDGYSKDARPVQHPNETVYVGILFALGRVESLEGKSSMLTTFGWLTMIWHDPHLRWNPSEHEDIKSIVIPASNVWLPEINSFNSFESLQDLGFETNFRIAIDYDGLVKFSPGYRFQTVCEPDMTFFPIDEQSCNITFTNWMYGEKKMSFYFMIAGGFFTGMHEENGHWTVVNSSAAITKLSAHISEDFVQSIPIISFSLTLKRNPTFYIINIVIPAIVLGCVSLLVFILPAESGEKVSLGITVVLSYTMILLVISEVSPPSGTSQPILSYFIGLTMVMAAISLMVTIGVLKVHHHSPHRPVPKWIRIIVLRGLACCLCFNTHGAGKKKQTIQPSQDNETTSETTEQITKMEEKESEMSSHLRYIRQEMKCASLEHNNQYEWQLVAKVLDRMFFILFLLVIFGASSALVFFAVLY